MNVLYTIGYTAFKLNDFINKLKVLKLHEFYIEIMLLSLVQDKLSNVTLMLPGI